ncbi:hypothetical protein [Blastococcus sp. SYSU DS0533]
MTAAPTPTPPTRGPRTAYDAALADRVRRALPGEKAVREVEMYLGVAGTRRAEMGAGRSMGEGWVAVDEQAVAADEDLRFWVDAVLERNAEQIAPR